MLECPQEIRLGIIVMVWIVSSVVLGAMVEIGVETCCCWGLSREISLHSITWQVYSSTNIDS